MNRNKPYPNPRWDLASLVFGNHPIKAKCARAFMSRKACHAYIGIGEIPSPCGVSWSTSAWLFERNPEIRVLAWVLMTPMAILGSDVELIAIDPDQISSCEYRMY